MIRPLKQARETIIAQDEILISRVEPPLSCRHCEHDIPVRHQLVVAVRLIRSSDWVQGLEQGPLLRATYAFGLSPLSGASVSFVMPGDRKVSAPSGNSDAPVDRLPLTSGAVAGRDADVAAGGSPVDPNVARFASQMRTWLDGGDDF
jgi:hypothetical protein